MGRLAFICIGCGILGAHLAAQAAARTYFEERLLDRAPVVVRARFDADQSCFDVDVAAFLVKQKLRGEVDPAPEAVARMTLAYLATICFLDILGQLPEGTALATRFSAVVQVLVRVSRLKAVAIEPFR